MTKTTRRLWKSLEAAPALAGVRFEWQDWVGEDLPLLDPFLRPAAKLAETYPCPSPGGDGCPRGVVRHESGRIVAVCRDRPRSCDDLTLTHEDIVVHRLDLAALAAHVAGLLCLKADEGPTAVDGLPRTLRIGAHCPHAGIESAAYLTLRSDRDEFSEVVERLVAREGGPFLLFAPTTDLLGPSAAERLSHADAMLIGLADFVAADEFNRLVVARPAEEVLRAFRDAAVKEAAGKLKEGMVYFPTPAGATWKDVEIRFSGDTHTVSVRVLTESGVYNYTQMGMADGRSSRPTGPWDFLYAMARVKGFLTWESREAHRRRKKQCQRLVAALRQFFHLQGDPIPFRKKDKAWYTRFQVHES